MNKCLIAIVAILGLTSCTVKDEHYYQVNPDKLQQAMQACPGQQPQGLNCEQIEALAKRMNSLAYQLQINPQGFGTKIMQLQQTIADLQNQLKNEKDNSALQANLDQNKQNLADHLAVVRWLESPAS